MNRKILNLIQSPWGKMLLFFIVWKFGIILFFYLGGFFVPLGKNFLGGGYSNYLENPFFWSHANFDGEHYLSIAQSGYKLYEQAFFPLYPILVRFLGDIFGKSLVNLAQAGILISNLSFYVALVGLYKLISLDYSKKIANLAAITLLVFPTSFFFGLIYTESLFLALSVWSIFLARRKSWAVSSLLACFASATRLIGVFLLPVIFLEWLSVRRFTKDRYSFLWFMLVPLGILFYMYYLYHTTGDALYFLHSLPSFGEQRSSVPILLPQVYYRYFFKILPNINYGYTPIVLTTLMELLTGVIFTALSMLGIFKLRLSYAAYLLLGFLTPTLSGSFSSLPRYVLVLFPAFILFGILFQKLGAYKFLILLISLTLLAFSAGLFFRGNWIS